MSSLDVVRRQSGNRWRAALIVCGLILLAGAAVVTWNARLDAGASAFKENDGTRALHELLPLAMLGDTRAQFIVGDMYALGLGVAKNDADAVYWFRRAALFAQPGEDPAAELECGVGESYAKGPEVSVDTIQSVKWLRLAARGGSKKAVSMLRDMRIQ
jgi:TPR repeat protein